MDDVHRVILNYLSKRKRYKIIIIKKINKTKIKKKKKKEGF